MCDMCDGVRLGAVVRSAVAGKDAAGRSRRIAGHDEVKLE